jgi:hypothetical protein
VAKHAKPSDWGSGFGSAVPRLEKKNHSNSGGLLMRDKFNELITTL